MFCLHVQEKPQASIPWVHLHVVISTSSLVPLLRGWELTAAHTGSRMSLCIVLLSICLPLHPCPFFVSLFLSLTTQWGNYNSFPASCPGLFHPSWDSPLLLG